MGAVMKIKICNDVLHRLHSTYQIWLNFINIDITFFLYNIDVGRDIYNPICNTTQHIALRWLHINVFYLASNPLMTVFDLYYRLLASFP